MQLKRGWWKQNDGKGHSYLAGNRGDKWYGELAGGCPAIFGPENTLLDVFCGDGPEPIEPVQLCLGWWERANKSTTKFVGPSSEVSGGRTYEVWCDSEGNRYNVDGTPFWATTSKGYTIVRRRPDLDSAEQPDPRDAEIERLLHTLSGKEAHIETLERRVEEQDAELGRLKRLVTENAIEQFTSLGFKVIPQEDQMDLLTEAVGWMIGLHEGLKARVEHLEGHVRHLQDTTEP